MVTGRASIDRWLPVVETEFREMPGLCLTKPQMRRLWGLDTETCDAVIDTLLTRRFLTKAGDAFVLIRPSGSPGHAWERDLPQVPVRRRGGNASTGLRDRRAMS
jgi:hypothetical protein